MVHTKSLTGRGLRFILFKFTHSDLGEFFVIGAVSLPQFLFEFAVGAWMVDLDVATDVLVTY